MSGQSSSPVLNFYPAVPLDPVHMYETALDLKKTTAAVRTHYECSPLQPSVADKTIFVPQDELLELLDFPTRLEIERGKVPLDQWIDERLKKDVLSMNKRQLDLYLRELRAIEDNKWIKKAHAPRDGFFEKISGGWKEGKISAELSSRITLVNALWKIADGQTLTEFQEMLIWGERQKAKKH